ncbi:MAG TPA: hypothetical protein VGO66_10260 [Solirubrobacterales bacterium]|jgi:hypothetical protein|nr:hypothetical protein [Solirubrobacterales bacterium]
MRKKVRSAGIAIAVAMLTLLLVVAPASARPEGGVLVVGDSLEELTSPYIAQFLPPGVELTVNAVGGYNSFQIFDLFEESYDPSHSVIVFDAGTNDNPAYPEILAGNLAKVAAIVGDSCMVVPTIHGFTVDGVSNDGKNRVVREFAASRPGTQVPDWAGFEVAHPELMQADDLHPIEAGAEARAELIAQGVLGCLSGASTQFGAAPGAGPSASASAQSAPLLASAPAHMPPVGRLARRQTQLLRAAGAAVLGQGAVLLARGVFPRR